MIIGTLPEQLKSEPIGINLAHGRRDWIGLELINVTASSLDAKIDSEKGTRIVNGTIRLVRTDR